MLFTDINFIPPDRYPSHDYKIKDVNELIVKGLDVHSATKPLGKNINSMSMLNADKDEDFNTRLGSYEVGKSHSESKTDSTICTKNKFNKVN